MNGIFNHRSLACLPCGLLLSVSLDAADPSLELEFLDFPGVIQGGVGQAVSFEVFAIIRRIDTGSLAGAQGWGLAFHAEGGRILEVTTAGILVSALWDSGSALPVEFDLGGASSALNVVLPYPGGSWGVSSVILDRESRVALRSEGGQAVARIVLEATPGEEPIPFTLSFRDDSPGFGMPFSNGVIVDGAVVKPILGSATAMVRSDPPPGGDFALALVPMGGAAPGTGDAVLELTVFPGEVLIPVEVRLGTARLSGSEGPQGWSLSIEHQGPLEVHEVSVDGLEVDVLVAGSSEKIDLGSAIIPGPPDTRAERATGKPPSPLSDDARGVVSAVVLSSSRRMSLPPNTAQTVLRIVYRLSLREGEVLTGRALFRDGLAGTGQPVHNVINYQGASLRPTSARGIRIRVAAAHSDVGFIRGDPNLDGRVDLADAIWIFQDLFISPVPRTECLDAGDANGSGGMDLSDGIFILKYLFQAGRKPPGSFPFCETLSHSCPTGADRC